jgi:fibronectin type 3 domain-containing protein
LTISTSPAASAATNWTVRLATASHGKARGDTAPAAPTGVTAACQGVLLNDKIVVSWSAVTHASAYQVYDATSANGTYTTIGSTVTTTTQTVTIATTGSYWFKVQALAGTHWTSPQSTAAGPRTITIALLCT